MLFAYYYPAPPNISQFPSPINVSELHLTRQTTKDSGPLKLSEQYSVRMYVLRTRTFTRKSLAWFTMCTATGRMEDLALKGTKKQLEMN